LGVRVCERTMRKLLCSLALLLAVPLWATSYYLSPTGSDSNNGLSSGAPLLTPNHAVNRGDTIMAAASTSYTYANFTVDNWGTVTCTGAPKCGMAQVRDL
jgi:hypothetical protein